MRLTKQEEAEFSRYFSLYDFRDNFRGKTFLITGATGQIGSGIVKWILRENEKAHLNARIIASSRTPECIPNYIESDDPIVFCQFGCEPEFCKNIRIDCIIHSASPTSNKMHAAHPVETLKVIFDETEKMLDIAKANHGCNMIYLSSEEVYGLPKTQKPLPETYFGAVDSLTARSCYPLGKKAAELLCYNYTVEYGTNVKIVRFPCCIGLLQRYEEERVCNEILRCLVERKNLVMKSAGLTKKCILYTLDAASASFTILFKGQKGEAYNATNPDTFLTVKDLADHLFDTFQPELSIEYTGTDVSVREGYLPQRSLLQDNTKISKLGWKPKTSLERIYEIDLARFASQKA